jgi:hypothetical protein
MSLINAIATTLAVPRSCFEYERWSRAVFIKLGRHGLFAEITQDLHPSLPWFEHRSRRTDRHVTHEWWFGKLAMCWDRPVAH